MTALNYMGDKWELRKRGEKGRGKRERDKKMKREGGENSNELGKRIFPPNAGGNRGVASIVYFLSRKLDWNLFVVF